MTSFDLDIVDEKALVGSRFMSRVVNEIQRAAAIEKASRKEKHQGRITQQAIADKIGTTRAVINRQMQGLENLGARRIAEILWAIGWEPHFEARRIQNGDNNFYPARSDDFVISLDATSGDGSSQFISSNEGEVSSEKEIAVATTNLPAGAPLNDR